MLKEALQADERGTIHATMVTAEPPDQKLLRERLLQRLRPFATTHPRKGEPSGLRTLGSQLCTYCAFDYERIRHVRMAHPVIGIVLSGAKEVWLADVGQRVGAGEVFVLPGGVSIDVVNDPDERRGVYESLIMEVRPAQFPQKSGRPGRTGSQRRDVRVALTPDLADAIGHAAIALSDTEHAQELAKHRLAEVLLLLRDEPAAQPLFASSVADRVEWMLLEAPSEDWTVRNMAERLGLGASSLRRELARSGLSFRSMLAKVRMQVARDVLASGEGNVTAAAQAAGYVSRSHFARRFREVHGHAPSASRAGGP